MKETNGIFELDSNDFVVVAGEESDEFAVVVCDRNEESGLKVVRVGKHILFSWLEKGSKEHPIEIYFKTASTKNEVHLCAPLSEVATCISESKVGDEYQLDIQFSKFNFLDKDQELNNKQQKQVPQTQEMEMDR